MAEAVGAISIYHGQVSIPPSSLFPLPSSITPTLSKSKEATMLVIVGATGKLGHATLTALLKHSLLPASEITCTTSSPTIPAKLAGLGVSVKTSVNWDSPSSVWEDTFRGADKVFLISSARIEKDYFDAAAGGREADHFKALNAAVKVGVGHVYYTSLAFARPGKSLVMRAHERTEECLEGNAGKMKWTVMREGLYNESWPLYLGHYDFETDAEKEEIVVAGEGKVSWTSIADLGLASAMVLAAPGDEWAGKTFYLAQERAYTLQEVAEMVGKARGKDVKLRFVEKGEHEKFHVRERKLDEGMVKWWSPTYEALKDGECEIHDPTLERLLAKKGLKPEKMEDTVAKTFKS